MNTAFPKRRKTDVTAEIGVNLVSTIVNDDFGWVFRRTHQEHDFGVDGYIDYVDSNGGVTGQFIAVQIKTGNSYLSKSGSVHWYMDTKEHLNYFLNLPTPIVLIICDPSSKKCYWAVLKKEEVEFKGNSWRFPIPKSETLNKNSIEKFKRLFGDSIDHLAEFKEDQELLNLATSSSFIQYRVPRDDIESNNITNLQSFLSRITRNEKLTLEVQGKLYIGTYGYEGDSREVFQIKDVRKWAKKAREKINCWYLCASGGQIPPTLPWMAACTTNVNAELMVKPSGRSGYQIQYTAKELLDFMNECFDGLNKASDKWGWSTRLNYDISKLIHKELFPDMPFPEFKEDG